MTTDDLELCDTPHPNYPDLRCVRLGKCYGEFFDHIGIVKHRFPTGKVFEEIVVWGTLYKSVKSSYRVIPMDVEEVEVEDR